MVPLFLINALKGKERKKNPNQTYVQSIELLNVCISITELAWVKNAQSNKTKHFFWNVLNMKKVQPQLISLEKELM